MLSFFKVGMTGFEPATSRTLSGYSNRTEPHPEVLQKYYPFVFLEMKENVLAKKFIHASKVEMCDFKSFKCPNTIHTALAFFP